MNEPFEIYRVEAVDEFERLFTAQWVIPLSDSLYFKVQREVVFEMLVRDILRAMGEAAWAEWKGETRVEPM